MDYFKNNDTEILYSINVNIKELMVLLKRFFSNFSKILLEIKKINGNMYNFDRASEEVNKFCKIIENKHKNFYNSSSIYSIRDIFENLSNNTGKNSKPGTFIENAEKGKPMHLCSPIRPREKSKTVMGFDGLNPRHNQSQKDLNHLSIPIEYNYQSNTYISTIKDNHDVHGNICF